MQFFKKTITTGYCSYEINILFTGKRYIFTSNTFGIVAVATRDDDDMSKFLIETGSSHLKGCSLDAPIKRFARRFVTQKENQFVKKDISFTEIKAPLHNYALDINIRQY